MILLIDNYDSFAYNLYQMIGSIYPDIEVIRNDEDTLEGIAERNPEAIILSPGPGKPEDAGICQDAIQHFAGRIPILGVCLGHQAICQAFGATVSHAKKLVHGKQEPISIDTQCNLFLGLPQVIQAARYHSLSAQEQTMPDSLQIIAKAEDGEIMAVKHRNYPIYGVQFHPESIMTPEGKQILMNFFKYGKEQKNREEQKMILNAMNRVIKGENLDFETAKTAMNEIIEGEATHAQIASYLTALRMKGETIDEITASASAMREKAVSLNPLEDVLDIVGTGGDEANTFNISTTSAFVIAAAGVPVAKHGNRSVSSKSGSADVLEKLGVNIRLSVESSEAILKKMGMCFLFAQTHHVSMKHAAPVRKEIGVRTIFNILGPLCNPAGATMQLMGVYEEKLVEPLAKVLANLGVKKGMVVYGCDGLDEATLTTKSKVCEIRDGRLSSYYIYPEELGLATCSLKELVGGGPEENAEITLSILMGREQGPKRSIVLLNAGLSIYIAGVANSIEEGIAMAAEMIDSGKAMNKLQQLIQLTNEVVL